MKTVKTMSWEEMQSFDVIDGGQAIQDVTLGQFFEVFGVVDEVCNGADYTIEVGENITMTVTNERG